MASKELTRQGSTSRHPESYWQAQSRHPEGVLSWSSDSLETRFSQEEKMAGIDESMAMCEEPIQDGDAVAE